MNSRRENTILFTLALALCVAMALGGGRIVLGWFGVE